jgi:citrate lyase subunit beta-like protein
VIPKVDSPKDLHFVTDVLRHILPSRHPSTPTAAEDPTSPPPIRLIALIESARSLLSLPAICTASPYLDGLVFAAEDFARDLSLTRTPDLTEFLYARSAIVTAARAHAIPSVLDLVATTFRGEEGRRALADECRAGSRLGFNGKQCIHPDQVAVAQEAFAPAAEEVEWAVRVLVCDAKAGVGEGGRAAWTLDGKMVDVPVVGRARGLVERARGCGVDVDAVWERFREEEPQ